MPGNDKKKATPKGDAQEDRADNPSSSEKFIQEQLAALTAISDTKVDDLAGKLQTRMSKAETDLARLTGEMASTKRSFESLKLAAEERDKTLPQLVEDAVRARLASNETKAARRPRPLPVADTQLSTLPPSNNTRNSNEDKYWLARKTLRMWPVPGQGDELKTAAIAFLESKLQCPPGRVRPEDLEVRRVYSPGANRPGSDSCLFLLYCPTGQS